MLQLFCLPLEHFLLIALCISQLLLIAQIAGEFGLAFGELIQFFHDVVGLLLLLLWRNVIAGLVLIERQIHFQLIHLCQVLARTTTATTAAATALLRYCDVVEYRFSAQQMLQGFLGGLDGCVQLGLRQLLGSRVHALHCQIHVADKVANLFVIVEATRTCAICQGRGLFSEGVLQIRQQLGIELDLAIGIASGFVADQVPGGHDDLALTFGNFILLLAATTTASATARQLRLRIAAVIGLDLDEEHVGTHCLGAISGFCVKRNQVAWLQRSGFGRYGFISRGRRRFFIQRHFELADIGCGQLLAGNAQVFQHENMVGSNFAHGIFQ